MPVLLGCGAGSAGSGPDQPGGHSGGSAGLGGAVTASGGAFGGSGGDSPEGPGGVGSGGQPGASGSAGSGGTAPLPTQERYLSTLYQLSDLLLTTQIDAAGDTNDGALVSPSTNPDPMPIHSRAAEAVSPLAVAFKHSQDEKYANAAVRLGDWLISVQTSHGSWIEEWPSDSGWDGTTADQLISLAKAYGLLKGRLTPTQDEAWSNSIARAASWIESNFPKGNINYAPTGAVALVCATQSVADPKPSWLTKAASLMSLTLEAINDDTLLTGEGRGVDLGYNIAQSIGMIALYGRMLQSELHLQTASELLRAHQHFMYPSGATFNELRIGWVNYQSKAETTTLWLDDLALGPQRIGCLEPNAATH